MLYLSYILTQMCFIFPILVSFEAVPLMRGRLLSREQRDFGAAECGKPLRQAARFNASAVPHLRI
jgi:hypothetical protein